MGARPRAHTHNAGWETENAECSATLAGLVEGYMAEGQEVYSRVNPTLGPSVLTTSPLTIVPFWAFFRTVPYLVRFHILARSPPMLGTAWLLEVLRGGRGRGLL